MIKPMWWILDSKGVRIGYTQDFVFAVELRDHGFNVVQEEPDDVHAYS
jgi:hypothetical protein